MIRSLWREHRRQPFDVLHGLWLHEPGSVAVVAGAVLRVPVVASIGGAEVANLPRVAYGALRTRRGRLMTSFVLRRASVVTGGSCYVLKRASALRRGPEYVRAPLPVDAQLFRPTPDPTAIDPASPRLLHAASIVPVKDQSTLLDAFARIVRDIPGATLTLAGEDPFGNRRALESAARHHGIASNIHFSGAVEHASMPGLYQAADLFLLSSLHESQGLVVLEAAASAVTTVGSAVGVVPDLIVDGCVAVPPGDPDALAAAAVRLLRDPARLQTAGSALRARVLAEYDAHPATARFLQVYRDVAERRRR
jgi:glycosyltransferase involved in cell wall biosynthesis